MSNLIYGVNDKPKTIKEYLGYSFQVLFSCITATLLIALICNTNCLIFPILFSPIKFDFYYIGYAA